MKNFVVLLIALVSIGLFAGTAFASSVVFYLDEYGTPYGYLNPKAYDIVSALGALPTPPTPEEAGRVLTSAVPAGTAVLDFRFEEDTAVVAFSSDVVAGLSEARLADIFDQVRNTLRQFGVEQSIKMLVDDRPLSDYLAPVPAVEPGPAEAMPKQLGLQSLSAKKITVSPGHGKRWNGSTWTTARPVYCSPLNQVRP